MTDGGSTPGSVTLGFSDIVYTAPTRRWPRSKASVRNVILNGVSGSFAPGTLTAIMGPSGAGKTSLLDILAGYKMNNVEGRISVNGAIREKRSCLRHLQSYTLQDDDLPPYITVEEAMTSAAALKLGPSVPTAQRTLKVEDVLQSLGLSSCRETFCCRISGGQRKRLSIALELISNPPIMFFDEPTSGLDSASCLSCIALLRSLARQGRTIVCTIHQPSSRVYDQFDQLYVLAVGVCVYRGSRQLLVPYLSAAGLNCPSYYTPADFVIEVASGEFGDWTNLLMKSAVNGKSTRWILPSSQNGDPASPDICIVQGIISPSARLGEPDGSNRTEQSRWCSRESDASPSDIEPRHSTAALSLSEQCSVPVDQTHRDDSTGTKEVADSDHLKMLLLKQLSMKTGFPASTSYQFQVLLCRTFKSILRNKMLTSIRLVSYVLFALLMGALYYRIGDKADRIYNNAAHVFFDLMFIVFSSLMPTILTFPLEMAVFRKEYMNGWYSVKAYYLAKTAADLPFQMAFPVLYTGIVYYLTGQPADWQRFALFSLVMILAALLAQSVGLLIGACCCIQAAVFLGPVSMMPAILFCGFFINLSRIPVWLSWISLLSFSRYSFEALMLSLYGFGRHNLACSVPYCHFRDPDKFLQELSMDGADYWLDVLVLVLMVFVLRLLGYFVLRWKVGQER